MMDIWISLMDTFSEKTALVWLVTDSACPMRSLKRIHAVLPSLLLEVIILKTQGEH